jgi:KamA family protein
MSWSKDLAKNVRDVQGLLPYWPFSNDDQTRMDAISQDFPRSITSYYLSLINFSDPDDPIRKMAIPSVRETDLTGSFDTSGEADNTVIDGLQHKYAQTVMMLSTNQCAMYCRHCFRKRLVGLSDDEVAKHFDEMRDCILQHTEISNVLVSGGDALLNTNDRLDKILGMLCDIPHLQAIRIASRVPVVFPQRITEDTALLEMLQKYAAQKQLYFVTQFNHPRELTPQAIGSIRLLHQAGVPAKNQTVLLRGVNDKAAVLGELLGGLVSAGIVPYYVFQCRPVSGVKNQFQVPFTQGWQIVQEAKNKQNGMGKSFRYAMSHVTGKLEILGPNPGHPGEMLFQYHEAHTPQNLGRILSLPVGEDTAWLQQEVL